MAAALLIAKLLFWLIAGGFVLGLAVAARALALLDGRR